MALSIDCFSTPAPPSAFRDLWPAVDANSAGDENCAVPDVRALKQRMEARLGAVDALVAAAEAAAEPAPSSALVELQERWAAALRCDDATPSEAPRAMLERAARSLAPAADAPEQLRRFCAARLLAPVAELRDEVLRADGGGGGAAVEAAGAARLRKLRTLDLHVQLRLGVACLAPPAAREPLERHAPEIHRDVSGLLHLLGASFAAAAGDEAAAAKEAPRRWRRPLTSR